MTPTNQPTNQPPTDFSSFHPPQEGVGDDEDYVDAEDDEYMATLKRLQQKVDRKRVRERGREGVGPLVSK